MAMPERMIRRGVHVGVERQLRALRFARRDRHGYDGDGWTIHLHGAASELCVAWLLNQPWGDTPELDYDGDVGPGVQVRWTPLQHGGLLVHPSDPDDHAFVLVRGRLHAFDVVGWAYGREAKQPQFWRTDIREPAFIMPAQLVARAMPDCRWQVPMVHGAHVL